MRFGETVRIRIASALESIPAALAPSVALAKLSAAGIVIG